MIKKIIRITKGLVSYPVKKKAFNHILQYSSQRPLDINIETSTICPMSCKFCCNRLYDRGRNIMPNEMFQSIIKQYVEIVGGGGTIGIGSMQSDFLSDPLILERMKIIKQYRKSLWVHSTTPFLSAARFSDDELLDIISNMDYIVISVEGHDSESYKKMCGVDGFETLVKQLYRVKKLITDNNIKIDISLAFRTYDRNELINSESYKELISLFREENILDEFFSWFGSIKESDLPKGAKLKTQNNDDKKVDCVVPYATLAIQANGNVVGCGCIDWLESNVIGNINESSLLDIWLSDKARAFRNAFSNRNGELPQICKECGLYTPITCFKRAALRDYESKDGLYYYIK